jgi:hypothetical protein
MGKRGVSPTTILLVVIAICSVCIAITVVSSKWQSDAAMERVSQKIIEMSKQGKQK